MHRREDLQFRKSVRCSDSSSTSSYATATMHLQRPELWHKQLWHRKLRNLRFRAVMYRWAVRHRPRYVHTAWPKISHCKLVQWECRIRPGCNWHDMYVR